jgi:hypothetical protein
LEPAAGTAGPAAKKAKTGKNTESATSKVNIELKTTYQKVVEQINHLGPAQIQHKTLHSVQDLAHQRMLAKQDPLRAQKRRALGSELRRMSIEYLDSADAEGVVQPAVVASRVKQAQKKKDTVAKVVQKAVVGQLKSLGEDGVHELLRKKRLAPHSSKVQKSLMRRQSKLDTKRLQQKTLDQLSTLVTPTVAHRPAKLREKLEARTTKQMADSEAVKQAMVKEIRRLGESGVKALVQHARS